MRELSCITLITGIETQDTHIIASSVAGTAVRDVLSIKLTGRPAVSDVPFPHASMPTRAGPYFHDADLVGFALTPARIATGSLGCSNSRALFTSIFAPTWRPDGRDTAVETVAGEKAGSGAREHPVHEKYTYASLGTHSSTGTSGSSNPLVCVPEEGASGVSRTRMKKRCVVIMSRTTSIYK